MPPNIPRCAREQSTENWWALTGGNIFDLIEFRRCLSMFGILFTFFHISYRITALFGRMILLLFRFKCGLFVNIYQIREYSIVHGNRNGDASWMRVVIMVESLQADRSISLCRLVNKCSGMSSSCDNGFVVLLSENKQIHFNVDEPLIVMRIAVVYLMFPLNVESGVFHVWSPRPTRTTIHIDL